VQESRGRFWVTIPLTKMKILQWGKGQEVDWSFDKEGNLILMAVQEVRK